MLGNTLYGLSVLLKNPEVGQNEGSYVLHHLPWLVGSLGVLLLDTIVSFSVCRAGGAGWAVRPLPTDGSAFITCLPSTHPCICPPIYPHIHPTSHPSVIHP